MIIKRKDGNEKRILGNDGLEVSEIGLGCMGMDHAYGPAADRKEMIKLIHRAVEMGCNFLILQWFMEKIMKNF